MTEARAIENALQGQMAGKILFNEPMSLHTSLKLGGRAAALILIESEKQLGYVASRLKKQGIPFLPVGNLTNLLVCDEGYQGALLQMRGLDQAALTRDEEGGYYLDAQAGVTLSRLVGLAAAENLAGLEFCAGIPGSVGGAIWMNAGAYGKEMKDILSSVTVFDGQGEKKVLMREEIAFSYRKSNLPAETIICRARFQLQKGDGAQIKERIAQILKLRQEKHPLQYPSAGSVFKNPPGIAAGKLIEELGLKGTRIGDVQASKKHGNFIINKGQGTASDMLALIRLIQGKAKKERGVCLELEIVVLGEKL